MVAASGASGFPIIRGIDRRVGGVAALVYVILPLPRPRFRVGVGERRSLQGVGSGATVMTTLPFFCPSST